MDLLPNLIREYFGKATAPEFHVGPLSELKEGLATGTLTKLERRRILASAGVSRDENYRKAELDIVLGYMQAAVAANSFGREEQRCFELLKEVFEVQEGEFVRWRPVELATLLCGQLEAILEDDILDPAEDEYQGALQDALDLGFDQYMALCRRAFENTSLRLQEAIDRETDIEQRTILQRRLEALEPLIRIAESQRRTPGALY